MIAVEVGGVKENGLVDCSRSPFLTPPRRCGGTAPTAVGSRLMRRWESIGERPVAVARRGCHPASPIVLCYHPARPPLSSQRVARGRCLISVLSVSSVVDSSIL